MTVSLDSAESQCIRSERHVTSCRGAQVELVVWLAQMVHNGLPGRDAAAAAPSCTTAISGQS
jgi:hypothetical protein